MATQILCDLSYSLASKLSLASESCSLLLALHTTFDIKSNSHCCTSVFFSIDLFHCIKSNVLSCRLPILLWLFVTFIIFHFPIGKKLWGGPSPKTPTELMIVLQRFLTPHFFSSDEEPSFLCPAQAIPVGNMFSFNRCTLGVACKEDIYVPAKIF